MNFSLPPELTELRVRVRSFVDERIIPAEWAIVAEDAAGDRPTFRALQNEARAAGLWGLQLPRDLGGKELSVLGRCVVSREVGRSPVAASVLHCDPPDETTMSVLVAAGSDAGAKAIRERWLTPLVRGEISSALCITEPAPGAGSDRAHLRTRAERESDGDDWIIDGHKWYATGGGKASLLLVMARTGEASASSAGEASATLFAIPRDAVGVEHVRDVPTMGEPELARREAELRFHRVRVRDDAIVGKVGEGFALLDEPLLAERLTHCMRWLGLADRALELCKKQLETRQSFGALLGEHQSVQKKVADAVHGIHAGNLMTLHAAWLLTEGRGDEARGHASLCKNHVARLVCSVLDDAIQIHGGLGYSDDMPFARWYRHARAARIVDGPEEVHDVTIAREWMAGRLGTLA